jgi:sporulation protein YlmC with PRC-barrel domain
VPCLLSGEIKDKAVYSKDMIMLGKAKDLEFDPAQMRVNSLIVEFEKEVAKDVLGKASMIGHDDARIPTELIENIGKDAIILKQRKDELKI